MMAMQQQLKRRILLWALSFILAIASFILGLPNVAHAESTSLLKSIADLERWLSLLTR